MIKKAAGGILFLDEIGDLSIASQVKLLRVVENREYYPVGSDAAVKTDVRIIVVTNRNLAKLVGKACSGKTCTIGFRHMRWKSRLFANAGMIYPCS
jgi:transcriptional regulator with AAA-type ATPase domain